MSCRCCQPGDSSDGDYDEQEGEDVEILSISVLKERIGSLATLGTPPVHVKASENQGHGDVAEEAEKQQTLQNGGIQKGVESVFVDAAIAQPPVVNVNAGPPPNSRTMEECLQNGALIERVQSLAENGVTQIPAAYVRPVSERPQLVTSTAEIPVVDMREAGGEGRESVKSEVGRACEEWGFFQVVNHGVPLEVLEAMRRDGREFFELPMTEKLQYACKPGSIASEGYGSKMLVKDEQVLDWRDYYDLHTLPYSRRNPTHWPANPPSFRDTVLDYSFEMKVLAEKLLGLISESLGLPPKYIKDVIGEPSQNVSVNYYPACPQPDLTLGLQAHSDLGAITILMQADIAGLQVCKNGNWIAVQPLPNSLVVNLGDMMEVLTNGKYKSVEHRAVVNGQRDRLSIATFLDPAKDQVISPARPLVDEKHPLRYKEILFRDFIAAWYSKGPDGKRNIDNLVIPS